MIFDLFLGIPKNKNKNITGDFFWISLEKYFNEYLTIRKWQILVTYYLNLLKFK